MVGWTLGILIATIIYGVVIRISSGALRDPKANLFGGRGGRSKPQVVTIAYLLTSGLLLSGFLFQNTGCSDPNLSRFSRHLEFQGVSVSAPKNVPDADYVLTGSPVESTGISGFRLSDLPPGSRVELRPQLGPDGNIASYRVQPKNLTVAARINGVSINQPMGGWIPVGQSRTLRVAIEGRDPKRRSLRIKQEVVLSVRSLPGQAEIIGKGEDGPRRSALSNVQSLGDFLDAAHASTTHVALNSLVDSAGRPILDRIFLVRRRLSSAESESEPGAFERLRGLIIPAKNSSDLGIIVGLAPATSRVSDEEDAPYNDPPKVTVEGGAEQEVEAILARKDGSFRLTVSTTSGGYSSLRLPSRIEKSGRVEFLFDPPRSYALPPDEVLKATAGEITLTSAPGLDLSNGYVFDLGRPNAPILTRARLVGSPANLELSQPAPDDTSGTSWVPQPLNTTFAIGDETAEPLVRLADPLSQANNGWFLPLLGTLVGTAVLVFGLLGVGTKRVPPDFRKSWTLPILWVAIMTLLTARAVLAFRVTMLPPFNLHRDEALRYAAPWLEAQWALVIAGTLGAFGTLVLMRVAERRLSLNDDVNPTMELVKEWPARKWLTHLSYGAAFIIAAAVLIEKLLNVQIPMIEPGKLQLSILLLIVGFALREFGVTPREESVAKESVREEFSVVQSRTIMGGFAGVGLLLLLRTAIKGDWLAVPITLIFPAMGWWISDRKRWEQAWSWTVENILALAAGATFLADPGTFVYAVPLLAAAFATSLVTHSLTADRGRKVSLNNRFGTGGFLLLALCVTLVALPLLRAPLAALGREMSVGHVSKITRPLSSALPYRLVAGDPGEVEKLLFDKAPGADFRSEKVFDTLHQQWQMRSYVQAAPAGYFGTPLKNTGMTYSTMLSDASFSVFLVGEHGKLAAVLVLGIHLLIGAIFWFGAWEAMQVGRRRGNVLALLAVGSIFSFVAIYMALANLWLVPFTGQNIPLLSLRSIIDLVLFLGSASIGALLLVFPKTSDRPDFSARKRLSPIRPLIIAFPTVVAFGFVLLCASLSMVDGDPSVGFNLPKRDYDRLLATFRDARNELATSGSSGGIASTKTIQAAGPFALKYARAFDNRNWANSPVQPGRGLESDLRVDPRHFFVTSPFAKDDGVAWRGDIVATAPQPRYRLFVQGRPEPMELTSRGGAAWLTLGGRLPVKSSIDELILRDQDNVYGGIKLEGDQVRLAYNDTSGGKEARIYVNGVRPRLKDRSLVLSPMDVVTLRASNSNSDERVSVRYVGPSDGRVATVVWRNGGYFRVFPHGADLPVAYAVGEAGDELARMHQKVPAQLQLSVDLDLQKALQSAVARWASARGRAVSRTAASADGLPFTAVTVLDSYSGQIRGLAAVPKRDPNEDFDQVIKSFRNQDEAMISARSSWAFVNRTVGSTFKPMSFAALASKLNGKDFDLANVLVDENSAIRGDRYSQLGDLHLTKGVAVQGGSGMIDMSSYLRRSRTWPAVVTATMGLISKREDLATMLPGYQSGHPVARIRPGRALSDRLLNGKLGPQTIDQSLFFQGLFDCFSPNMVRFSETKGPNLLQSFLAPLPLEKIDALSSQGLASPEPHWADTTQLSNLDTQLVRYMIGSGECRWSAVVMAANAARIMTGKKVEPTLSTVAVKVADMPTPVSDSTWRRAHLLDPLFRIETFAGADDVRRAAEKKGYRIAMKSGTIADDGGRESEMLLFTIGKFDRTNFVPGHSWSGFISIRSAKNESGEGDDMVKGDLAKVIVPILVKYMK